MWRLHNVVSYFLGVALAIFIVFLGVSGTLAQTSPSQELLFTGQVDTAKIPDGIYNMTFRLYSMQKGGTALWKGEYTQKNNNRITIENGSYTVRLGSGEGNSLILPLENNVYYLSVQIGDQPASGARILIDTTLYTPTNIITSDAEASRRSSFASTVFCPLINFFRNPFGWCASDAMSVDTSILLYIPNVLNASSTSVTQQSQEVVNVSSVITPSSSSVAPVINKYITYKTNKDFTDEDVIQRLRTLEIAMEAFSTPAISTVGNVFDYEFVTKQTNRIYDSTSDQIVTATDDITTDSTLRNPTLSGNVSVSALSSRSLMYPNNSGFLASASGLSINNDSLTIGTTTAYEKLTVDGPVYLASVTPSTTTSRLYNNGGSLYWGGVLLGGASTGTWTVSGGDVYRATGNVGIGTTSPTQLLTVAGNARITGAFFDSNNASGTSGYVLQSTGTGTSWVATSSLGISGSGGVTSVGLSAPTGFSVANSPITTSGTLALSYAAGYEGLLTASSTNWNTFYNTPSNRITAGTGLTWTGNSLAADLGTAIEKGELANSGTLSFNWLDTEVSDALTVGPASTVDSQAITLQSGYTLVGNGINKAVATSSIYIANNGNVGIGTTLPSAKLSIQEGALNIYDAVPKIYLSTYLVLGDPATILLNPNVLELFTGNGDGIDNSFRLNTGDLINGSTTRLFISGISGNVGVGTTTPSYKLTVVGDVYATGTVKAGNLLGGATNLTTDVNGNIIRDPSDRRLKKNITNLENSLEKVLQLQGVRYQWKDEERFGTQIEIGFIAQDLDLVLPEVVRKGGDYWSINTRNILAVVVEGMKEMWNTVTGNTKRITELETENALLNNRLEEVEAKLDIVTPSASSGSDGTIGGNTSNTGGGDEGAGNYADNVTQSMSSDEGGTSSSTTDTSDTLLADESSTDGTASTSDETVDVSSSSIEDANPITSPEVSTEQPSDPADTQNENTADPDTQNLSEESDTDPAGTDTTTDTTTSPTTYEQNTPSVTTEPTPAPAPSVVETTTSAETTESL